MASSAKLLPFPFPFHFLFLIIILIHSAHLTRTTAQPLGSNGNLLGVDCTNSANYTTDSTYLANLNTLLSTLPSATTATYGFSNTSAGQHPDTVNAIALCRGDVSREVCRSCVSTVSLQLTQMCPNKKEAVAWHDFCMVRYSDKNIFHVNDGGYILTYWINKNVTSQDEFNSALRNLTDQLRSKAAAGDSLRKFATGNVTGPDFLTIYGLMKCTPDLSESDCGECLEGIRKRIPGCCKGKTQGRVIVASCNLRFQVDRFYEQIPAISLPLPPAPPPATESRSVPQLPPPTPPPKGKGKKNHTRRNVIVGVVTFAIVIGGIFIFFIIRRKRKQQKFNATEYDLNEIKLATGSFSQKNILGQGTFGVVYEGTLKDGTRIAVKKLKNNSTRDENTFKHEVRVLEKLRHPNLVRLLGFSRHETRMLLIYEFVPKGTLDKFIYGNVETPTLNWEKLYEIIKGIAKGLIYLHVESGLQIVHRDLKPSNILLDENMNPKIADFGTARLLAIDSTHCSTLNVVGTPGYIAPEYYHHSQYSFKTDVYSYGIIVLQILSGKKIDLSSNAEDSYDNLQSLAWRNWKTNDLSNIINSALEIDSSSLSCVQRCIQIGLLCIQQSAEERPSMQSVYEWLTNNSLSLAEPNQPVAFASRDLPLPTVGASHETDSIQASQFMTCTSSIHR